MATITPTVAPSSDGNSVTITWANMANGDSGLAVHERWADFSDRSVQVKGTLGAAGNLKIEGSNDGGTTYHTLADPQGNALDISSLKMEQILESAINMRPRVSAGDGTTSLTCVMFLRRPQPGRV